ncbi:MAG: glucosaminidase domain-containing protein [Chitinophagaceae bacterium]|nr:glucosaminidase domain-containing protein [Chitinophagaceae bacterium]
MKSSSYIAGIRIDKKSFYIRATALKTVLLFSLLVTGLVTLSQSKYVSKFRPMADSLSAIYGVPVSVMLGVAIMESGSGTSRNCKLLNNHFGIVGKNNLLKTKGIRSRYKQYPDALASYVDFCKLMTRKKFYTRLKGNMDHRLWADAISKAGYSEIPEIWKQRLLSIIKKNKLASLQ